MHSLGEIQHYDLNIPAMEESKGGKGDGERLTKCQISLLASDQISLLTSDQISLLTSDKISL